MKMTIEGNHKWKSGDFIISEVDKKFLEQNKIDMTVKDFKELIRKLEPSWIGLAGGRGRLRKVNVYNIVGVKNFIKLQYDRRKV